MSLVKGFSILFTLCSTTAAGKKCLSRILPIAAAIVLASSAAKCTDCVFIFFFGKWHQ